MRNGRPLEETKKARRYLGANPEVRTDKTERYRRGGAGEIDAAVWDQFDSWVLNCATGVDGDEALFFADMTRPQLIGLIDDLYEYLNAPVEIIDRIRPVVISMCTLHTRKGYRFCHQRFASDDVDVKDGKFLIIYAEVKERIAKQYGDEGEFLLYALQRVVSANIYARSVGRPPKQTRAVQKAAKMFIAFEFMGKRNPLRRYFDREDLDDIGECRPRARAARREGRR